MAEATATTPQEKAWADLRVAVNDLGRYLELHDAGVMRDERNTNARVFLAVDDAMRRVRFHASTTTTAEVPA